MKWMGLIFLAAFAYLSIPNMPVTSLQEMQQQVDTERAVYGPAVEAAKTSPCSVTGNLGYCLADAVRTAKIDSVTKPGCVSVQHGLPSHVVSWNAKTRIASYVTFDKGWKMWQTDSHNVYTVRFCY